MSLKLWLIKNNPDKLNETYWGTSDANDKMEIVQRLMELSQKEILFEIFRKDIKLSKDHKKIINAFLVQNSSDVKELHSLYFESDFFSKELIFQKMMKLGAEDELWDIYEKDKSNSNLIDLNNIMVDQLIDSNSDSPDKLTELFTKTKLYEQRLKIARALFKNKNELYLFDVANPIEATLLLFQCHDYSINDFFENAAELLSYAYSDENLAKFYFSMLNQKQQLYLLLYYYGIGDYISIEKYKIPLWATKIYYPDVPDAKTQGFDEFSSLFEKVFWEGFEEKSEKKLILSIILDRTEYAKKIEMFQKTRNIVPNLESATLILTKRYVRLMREESNESKIEALLEEKERELSKLLVKSDYEMIAEIHSRDIKIKDYKKPKIELPPLREFPGKPLDISTLDSKVKVTKVYEEEKDKIIKDMEEVMTDLDDARSIIDVKDKANKQLDRLIPRNRFCLGVKILSKRLANNIEYIDKLGVILVRNGDPEVRKSILEFSLNSKMQQWYKYLKRMFPIRDSRITLHIYAAILNIPNSENILHMLNIFNVKTGIDPLLLRISFLEHLHYLYFKMNPDDLQNLYKALNKVFEIHDDKRDAIVNVLNTLIRRAENKFKINEAKI
ncbi:MAG: hypothetical protein JXR48_04475 [Candidatus Delongbacteria bacterium]|nr:hypothetical protein [Candidatus Delongbacteria bacterium]MBN2834203.1 hypothetical protein [Candidatus Delongbacteria bacterium]